MRTVVLDEVQNPLRSIRVPLSDVAAAKHAPVRKGWEAFPAVMRHLERLAEDASKRLEPSEYATGIEGVELRAVWEENVGTHAEVIEEIDHACSSLWSVGQTRDGDTYIRRNYPYKLPPIELLRHPPREWKRRYANLEVLDVLDGLKPLYSPEEQRNELEREHGRLRVVREPDGTIWFELRRVVKLPEMNGVVLLAADGNLRLPDIRQIAGHRAVRIFAQRVASAQSSGVDRVYISTGRSTLSRKNILSGRELNRRGVRITRRVLAAAARRSRRKFGRRATLGILTLKPVARALLRVLRPESDRQAPDHVLAWARALRRELEAVADDLEIQAERLGHYELVGRGSNAFEDVDVLLMLGVPVPNLGQQAADARALHQDPDNRLARLMAATLLQGEGRARAIRGGEKLIVCAGPVRPPGWEGVETVLVRRGPPAHELREDVGELVAEQAADPEAPFTAAWRVRRALAEEVTGDSNKSTPIANSGDIPESTLGDWFRAAVGEQGLVRVRVPLRCRHVYALPTTPPEVAARAAVCLHGPEPAPRKRQREIDFERPEGASGGSSSDTSTPGDGTVAAFQEPRRPGWRGRAGRPTFRDPGDLRRSVVPAKRSARPAGRAAAACVASSRRLARLWAGAGRGMGRLGFRCRAAAQELGSRLGSGIGRLGRNHRGQSPVRAPLVGVFS